MATADIQKLTGELLVCWAYYKKKSLDKAGASTSVDMDRTRALYGEKLQELAGFIAGWDIPPRVAMAAMWSQALADKHMQGPFANALGSPNYLRRSLARYLGIPLEAVIEQTNRVTMVGKIEADYVARLPGLLEYCVEHGATAASMLSTVPACYRLMFLRHRSGADPREMSALALDALAEVDTDARLMAWLESRGITFDTLAGIANIEAGVAATDMRQKVVDAISVALELAKRDAGPEKVLAALDTASQVVRDGSA